MDDDGPLVRGHRCVLHHDGGVEPLGHGHARVRELPFDPARPARRVGHIARRKVGEVAPSHRYGIKAAGEHAWNVGLGGDALGQDAAHGPVERNLLDARHGEPLGQRREHLVNRLFPRQLDMVRMVSHDLASFPNRQTSIKPSCADSKRCSPSTTQPREGSPCRHCLHAQEKKGRIRLSLSPRILPQIILT